MDFQDETTNGDGATASGDEGRVFGRIVRYMSEQLQEANRVQSDDELAQLIATFTELAQAFETTGGFEFAAEQALPLSHTFFMIEQGMRSLSAQAAEAGQNDAAAKIEWGALQAKGIAAVLEEKHLGGAGGIIAFSMDDEDGFSPAFETGGTNGH
ncbi:hypothetical protein [Varunaivibrio sulfuroxidans]|uniref:Uncharacterized protein n=1 Tax=Varunaivibrio sulfuroxidans TaxID=1773489 RepID=A0A4R3JFQ1_9PROT|nr:hypothetical protein [Varunaivibrio sulfuroxidans]TCS64958.1 hypothetical protein EDD55_101289 [Varunaivibrio sulfuroxidans]WES29750.1 hypothetical protein P3M64_08825 [Varunaivibrio sulfuroxidans]